VCLGSARITRSTSAPVWWSWPGPHPLGGDLQRAVPGALLRFKEGRRVVVDIHNETDTPEQLHRHGRFVPVDVDGAAEEGTPYVPAHGMRRIAFTPAPASVRFYHTHLHAGSDLHQGQYNGQVGPVYVEPKREPGAYDRGVFLVLKEFEPFLSRGGDMEMDFLAPAARVKTLEQAGEAAMRASLTKGMPHGYEVGYRLFSINGRVLGHGEPIRVKVGERVLFHVLNGSATEIRSLALSGDTCDVTEGGLVVSPNENNRRTQAFRAIVASVPDPGTNTLVVTHSRTSSTCSARTGSRSRRGRPRSSSPTETGRTR